MKLNRGTTAVESIELWVKDFLNNKFLNNNNENSKKNYIRAMDRFKEYVKIKEDFKLEEMNNIFFDEYKRFLKDEGYASSSANQFLILLKMLLSFIDDNQEEQDFFKTIKKIDYFNDKEIKNKKLKAFTIEDRDTIIDFITDRIKKNPSFTNIRDFILVTILIYTGVREEELQNIKFSNIKQNPDNEDQYIIELENTKGDYEANVKIKKDFLPWFIIEEHLNNVKEIGGDENSYLCTTKTGKQMITRQIYQTTVNIGKKLGISPCNPHAFRHALGTFIANNPKVADTIGQKMLRHKNINTFLKFYVHTSDKDLSDNIDNIFD